MLTASRRARLAAHEAAEGAGAGTPPVGTRRGWVPEAEPPEADTSWLADPWGGAGGEAAGKDVDDPGPGPAAGRHRRGPRVLTVPMPFRSARLRVPWRAVVALAVVVLVAGVVFAVRVARAEVAAVPQVVPVGGLVGRTVPPTAFGSAATGSAGSVGSTARSSASATASERRSLVVDVVGQVLHPGVVSVPDGSRVGDVLSAAGGPLPDADVHRLNLARVVSDGEQVVVPRPGETPAEPLGGDGSGAGGAGGAGSAAATTAATVVDLNTATLTSLDTLPGVGPVLAQRILDWRGEHGRFSSVDELGEVSGIGDKLLAQIRSRVRV
jgi:competence protein ComEA